MNTIQKTIGALMIAGALGLVSCGPKPVFYPELPVSEIQEYFTEATETQAIDTAYYEVKDANGTLLGTVLFSSPFADNVKGYNGATPLLIALDAEGHIKNVVLQTNHETPRFAQRVIDGGLYDSWNGLTVEEALGKEVDAISGATYTSNGVTNSLKLRLEAYQYQLTKERIEPKGFWVRLFSK